MTAGHAQGGLGSLFSAAERARVGFFFVRHRRQIRPLQLKGFVMGRKTGLEAGRAGPRSLFSVIVVGPGCHRAVTAAAIVSLQAKGGLGSLFSAGRARVDFFLCIDDRSTLIDASESINSSLAYTSKVFRD